jgi:biotin transport system substrate-specific component
MSRIMAQILGQEDGSTVANVVPSADVRPVDSARGWTKQVAIVVAASLFVALCARVTVPLPFTPVPLTLQNFGVLAVGLLLGSRRGFAALSLYLMEGVCGLPVFSMGAGISHILGPTGGFLIAYPVVAFVAGWIYERRPEKSARLFAWAALSAVVAEVVLFASGLAWLAVLTHSISLAIRYGLYWFIFAEVIKVLMAAGIAARWQGRTSR